MEALSFRVAAQEFRKLAAGQPLQRALLEARDPTIPLVLAAVFVTMAFTGIDLQRISLGALIIGLGLLVDDAMIAVEMMIKKLEEGSDKITAATFAYTSTAFPMLTGTLVTIAGFVPVGFAASSAGEYTFTLFAVVAIAC